MSLSGSRFGYYFCPVDVGSLLFVDVFLQGLQAAANVSLDLDERPMPKGPLFPRWVVFCYLLAKVLTDWNT
jgi:hypothetical protein